MSQASSKYKCLTSTVDSDLQIGLHSSVSPNTGKGKRGRNVLFFRNFYTWNSVLAGAFGYDISPKSLRMRVEGQDLIYNRLNPLLLSEKRQKKKKWNEEGKDYFIIFPRTYILHLHSFSPGHTLNRYALFVNKYYEGYSFCCDNILEKFGGQRGVPVRFLVYRSQFSVEDFLSDGRNTNKFTKREKKITYFFPNSQVSLVFCRQYLESSERRVGTCFSVKPELPSISFLGSPHSLKVRANLSLKWPYLLHLFGAWGEGDGVVVFPLVFQLRVKQLHKWADSIQKMKRGEKKETNENIGKST